MKKLMCIKILDMSISVTEWITEKQARINLKDMVARHKHDAALFQYDGTSKEWSLIAKMRYNG